MSELKLCKDCKHFLERKHHMVGAGCAKDSTTNLVHGYVNFAPAGLVRISKKHCGPTGEWWEAAPLKPIKLSLWQRIKVFALSGTNSAGPGGRTAAERAELPCVGRQGGPR